MGAERGLASRLRLKRLFDLSYYSFNYCRKGPGISSEIETSPLLCMYYMHCAERGLASRLRLKRWHVSEAYIWSASRKGPGISSEIETPI